uniref:Cyclin-dependent kinase inhibitor 1B-like n=1 Tax=Seriola dumerili TaxID=41447 RepID=A0A3B4UQR0_SERDU
MFASCSTSSTFAVRRESVCRSLFGPVDHEQLRRDLTLKLREMTEQDSRRWNFNFQADVPLLGRFEWEEMPADRAAAFYQESAQLKDALGSAGADQENCSPFALPQCRGVSALKHFQRPSGRSAGQWPQSRVCHLFHLQISP